MARTRVLVIDDEAHFTHLLKIGLEQTGRYEVQVEGQGARAITAAREFKPDVILLDVIMPDISGDQIAERLKTEPDLQGIPVVFMTAIVSRSEVAHRHEIGGHPFLPKPATLEEIMACLEQWTSPTASQSSDPPAYGWRASLEAWVMKVTRTRRGRASDTGSPRPDDRR